MLANAFLASSSERARSGSPCGRCRPISACAIPSSYGIDRSVAIACARPQERIASDVRPWSHASAIEHRVPRPCERKDGGEAAHPTERNGGTRRRFSRCLARLPQVEVDLGRTAVAEERPEVGRSLVRAQAQRSSAAAMAGCRSPRPRLITAITPEDLAWSSSGSSGSSFRSRAGAAGHAASSACRDAMRAVRLDDEAIGLEATVAPARARSQWPAGQFEAWRKEPCRYSTPSGCRSRPPAGVGRLCAVPCRGRR